MRLTPERLTEIRARVAAASPGPWRRPDEDKHRGTVSVRDSGETIATAYCGTSVGHGGANADFIAGARADVPNMLAYIAELETGLATAIKYIDHGDFHNGVTDSTGSIDQGEVYAVEASREMRALIPHVDCGDLGTWAPTHDPMKRIAELEAEVRRCRGMRSGAITVTTGFVTATSATNALRRADEPHCYVGEEWGQDGPCIVGLLTGSGACNGAKNDSIHLADEETEHDEH